MDNNKKIEKRLKTDLGFDTCRVNLPQNNTQGEFGAECQNSYEDSFSCEGKFSPKEDVLSQTNCDKKE